MRVSKGFKSIIGGAFLGFTDYQRHKNTSYQVYSPKK
jgi:hypothetical protein